MKRIEHRPSAKSIYIWNIVGSIANAMLSVIALMIVTRFLDNKQADIFSIAWTISQLMATIGTFQIRTYQATDIGGIFNFQQYLMFRYLTIGLMIISSVGYILIKEYTGEKAVVVFVICMFRAVDSLADVYEGYFQQKERLDLAGKALTYRVIIALITFLITLFTIKNLLIACLSLTFSYVFCLILFDIRYINIFSIRNVSSKTCDNWILKMMKEGFPLFLNAFVLMMIMNTPKMEIDFAIQSGHLGNGSQTIFNIIFMPASFLNLAYIVFRPLITRMAVVWNDGFLKEFMLIILKIGGCLLVIGIGIFFASALCGTPILAWVYAINLSEYKTSLLVIIVGGCIYTFAAVLDNALVVIRKQYYLAISYIVTYIYIKVAANVLVPKMGIFGGALAYATAMTFFLATIIIIFILCLRKIYKR